MKLHFVEPPPELRVGGLDAAIRSLETALRAEGVSVSSGTARDAQPGDVVHFHGLWQPSHAKLSAELRQRNIAMAISPHGMLEPWAWRHKWWKKFPYFWMVERRHLCRAQCVLATAPQEEREIRRFLPQRRDVRTLPLGFTGETRPNYQEARTRLGWVENETVLLFLSRIHEKKGLDLLIEALAKAEAPRDTRLVIVGGGEPAYVRSVHSLADSVARRLPRVDWIGEIWGEERWPYFQGADLFCLPSHSENFGLAVLEACQVGTPVLTSTTTPWATWLRGDFAFIVSPTVSSVEEGLRKFFSRPKPSGTQREAFAESMRAEFSWSVLAPKYMECYREISSRSPHAPRNQSHATSSRH